MNAPYDTELRIACLAVQRASILAKQLSPSSGGVSLSKPDESPVTIADFAIQALLISALHRHFPDHGFLAEESSSMLREDSGLQDRVWNLVSSTHLTDRESEASLARPKSKEELLEVIELGSSDTHVLDPTKPLWILDPIDGTKSFLLGEQYAICLALIIGGKEQIGVMGCPNLSHTPHRDPTSDDGYGLMLFAVKGYGAYVRSISTGNLSSAQKVQRPSNTGNSTMLRMIDSPNHPAIATAKHQQVAQILGIPWPGMDLWAMQMKYAAYALGMGDIFIRIPSKNTFRPYVWDHAGGHLIFEESGGMVTDMAGRSLDFGKGVTLKDNYGLVASPPEIHDRVLEAVNSVTR